MTTQTQSETLIFSANSWYRISEVIFICSTTVSNLSEMVLMVEA